MVLTALPDRELAKTEACTSRYIVDELPSSCALSKPEKDRHAAIWFVIAVLSGFVFGMVAGRR